VACSSLTVAYSDTNSVSGSTQDTHVVTCDDGYSSRTGNSFTLTCVAMGPGSSEWSNLLTCDPVACSALTIANSDTTSVLGVSSTTHLVSCDDGYSSNAGNSFSVSCIGSGPGVASWVNVLTCSAVACPPLTVVYSDTTSFIDFTNSDHLVTCDDGYTSSVGHSFFSTCSGTSAGMSAWSNVTVVLQLYVLF